MGDTRGRGVGDRILRAISHPIRIEVLRLLENGVASPKELAREIGEKLGNVSYHCNYLLREGCIELVDTETRRGAVEHYYRLKGAQPYDLALRRFLGEAVRALNAGRLGVEGDGCLDWTVMELDETGRRELLDRQAQWRGELERLKADAARRLAEKGEAGRRTVAGTVGFEMPAGT